MEQYYIHFMNQRDVVEHCSGNLGDHKILMKHCLDKKLPGMTDAKTALNKREAKKEAKEAYMVMAFISGANRIKYGILIEELEKSYLKGNKNEYPKTVTDAYNLLLNYKNDPRNHSGGNTGGGDGTFLFNMLYEEYFVVSLNTNRNLESVECYYCHKKGHHKNERPEKLKADQDKTQKVTGQQHTQIAIEREDNSGT